MPPEAPSPTTPSESLTLEIRGLTSHSPRDHPTTPRFEKSLLDEARAQQNSQTCEKRPERLQTGFWPQQDIYSHTIAAKLRSAGLRAEADTLDGCHTIWTVSQCKGCSAIAKFANKCDKNYCPICQPSLARARRQSIEWWAKEINQPKHVVLTVINVPNLNKDHVREFKTWFTRLRRTQFTANWKGGFYGIEVTNEGRGWHLHLHALVDCRWIDEHELSYHWALVTNGMGRIVKVKDARAKEYLHEVTKYPCKGSQLAAWQPDEIAAFVKAFEGVRTFGVFGGLYGKRTKFRDWIKHLREKGRTCQCGCRDFWFFSELEWIERDLQPNVEARPPPPDSRQKALSL